MTTLHRLANGALWIRLEGGTGGGGGGVPPYLLNLSCMSLLFYTFPVSSYIMTRVTKCPKAIVL